MVSYDFYQNTYLGSALPEGAFKPAAARAEAWLSMLERSCYISAPGQDSRAMAVCAVAETIAQLERKQGIKSQSVGGVSVTYGDEGGQNNRLLRAAEVYLDICRGVDG